MKVDNPLSLWLQSTLFLFDLDTVRKAYTESYKLLPEDIRDAFKNRESGYLGNVWHSLDLLLCMHAYRDLQYGPKGNTELRRQVKLGWVAYNINAAQRLLNHKAKLRKELWKWYNDAGRQCRDEKTFNKFINFLQGYLRTTIAELAVLYVYLYNNRPIMPLGFMQHLVTLGPSGPTLGDFIDIETLTFIDVKSKGPGEMYQQDLLTLTITTRLPSAIAIPRYGVDEHETIREDVIVVEHYILSAAGKKQWIKHDKSKDLEAPIEDKLKPLMQNITILEDNARDALKRSRKLKSR